MGCQNIRPEIRVNIPDELWRRAARDTTAGAVILDKLGRVLLVKHSYGPLNWEIACVAVNREHHRWTARRIARVASRRVVGSRGP